MRYIISKKKNWSKFNSSNLKVVAKAKIDNIDHVTPHSQFLTDPSRLKRMKQKSELDLSLGLVRKCHNDASENKMAKQRASLVPLLIDAINKFKKR